MSTPTITDAAWRAPVAVHECQFCNGTEGRWERVYTGNEESLDGWEDWFCCQPCLDAGQPCETFYHLPIPPTETA